MFLPGTKPPWTYVIVRLFNDGETIREIIGPFDTERRASDWLDKYGEDVGLYDTWPLSSPN